MNKFCFTLLFLLISITVFGQKKSVIDLIKSDHAEGIGNDLIKVYNGTFRQDNSLLTSDSAYFHPKENAFDAFGHVRINQGDTLNIYSDKLNYNGNTKVAILTDHVRMVDKDATLYTDYLTYNTATRYATYTGGGKLVNKDNTLTSKNGYYYAFTRDSYFRYNVVLVTVDALIKTDTLRYNTGTRISYFYGPTDIYGTTGPKNSRDTLYTENGTYNTITEQAFFGKNNLYRQGTKTLKGDSLFYDKLKGFGKAVKHITFNDTEQKMTLKGDLGTYYKADERTVVTENAYGTLITEEDDTTKNDSAKIKPELRNKADTAHSKKDLAKKTDLKDNKPAAVTKTPAIAQKPDPKTTGRDTAVITAAVTSPKPPNAGLKTTSKDTTSASAIATTGKASKTKKPDKGDKKSLVKVDSLKIQAPVAKRVKQDTIFYTADTLQTQILTWKDLKAMQENMRLLSLPDSSGKIRAALKRKLSKILYVEVPKWPPVDTSYFHRDFFGKPPVSKKKLTAGRKSAPLDRYRRGRTDSVYMQQKIELSDTARVRILSAFRHAKMFKSDLQAKADSIFYSNSDSTIRCYVNPIIWTQGSQLTGDTIYLQMRNKKLDNMDMFPHAFIVNTEKGDSVNFNQVAGKKMRGFFHDGKLSKMFVDGNAETIYFSRDSLGKLDGMQRSLSSQVRVNLKDGEVTQLAFFTKPENQYGPPTKLKDDDRILKGFIWKPRERPASKEAIIPSPNKKPADKILAGRGQANDKGKGGLKMPTAKDLLTIKSMLPAGRLQINPDSLKSAALPLIRVKDTTAIKMTLKTIPLISLPKRDSVKMQ